MLYLQHSWPNSDFEYYIESGSARFPVTAMNTKPTYHTVIVNENPLEPLQNGNDSSLPKPVVYPNPNNGNFKVDLINKCNFVKLTIVDPTGRITQRSISCDTQYLDMNLDGASGVYFLIFYSPGIKYTVKVVKS